MDGTVLLADDDTTIRTVISQALVRAGCRVRATSSANTLWRWISEGEGNMVICDVVLPDGDGIDLLMAVQRRRPNLPVIVISAQNTVVTTIRAMESGAFDYLPKPFDLRELLAKTHKALSQGELAALNKTNRAAEGQDSASPSSQGGEHVSGGSGLSLIGSSPAMQELYRLVARVLNTDINVMISGKTGVGKSLLAQSMHDLSDRKDKDFIQLHSPSLSVGQLNKAITGAGVSACLYFSKVDEMAGDVQIRLLELMRSDAFRRQGFRIFSSTAQVLSELVDIGQLREDLFFRLNVVPMVIPSLSERRGDIAELARHFLHKGAGEGLPFKTINRAALDILSKANWAGNVRELENFIKRLAVVAQEDEISADDVSANLSVSSEYSGGAYNGGDLSVALGQHIKGYFDSHGGAGGSAHGGLYHRVLREVELPLITHALAASHGNQLKTAEMLGVNRNTLRKKIQDLDIVVTRGKRVF